MEPPLLIFLCFSVFCLIVNSQQFPPPPPSPPSPSPPPPQNHDRRYPPPPPMKKKHRYVPHMYRPPPPPMKKKHRYVSHMYRPPPPPWTGHDKSGLNSGERFGLLFGGIIVILQVPVAVFLMVKWRQLFCNSME